MVHVGLSNWIRRSIQLLQDGEQSLRVIGSVEALLLLSEWPLLPLSSPSATLVGLIGATSGTFLSMRAEA